MVRELAREREEGVDPDGLICGDMGRCEGEWCC
jgi:hypothetical protein